MAYQLEFEKLLNYEVGEPGITLQTTLKIKEQTLDVSAKVDTGASCCLFERRLGEALGFERQPRKVRATAASDGDCVRPVEATALSFKDQDLSA